jgi:hypothetical protein
MQGIRQIERGTRTGDWSGKVADVYAARFTSWNSARMLSMSSSVLQLFLYHFHNDRKQSMQNAGWGEGKIFFSIFYCNNALLDSSRAEGPRPHHNYRLKHRFPEGPVKNTLPLPSSVLYYSLSLVGRCTI